MVKKSVSGYEAFREMLKELETTTAQLNIYFVGQNDETGKSWCCDCVKAHPFVTKAVKDFAIDDSIFLEVDVGNREYWKNSENPFRTDKDIKLTEIPTLLRWNNVKRLEGDQCSADDLLKMFFEADDSS